MIETELIIVGAGPIGIEVASAFHRAGYDYLHFEAGQIGSTIYRWPRDTRFFSSPERLAIAGIPIQSRELEMPTGEAYLAYLRNVVETLDLPIRTYERVASINKVDDGFEVQTRTRTEIHNFRTTHIVLATGDMTSANLLGIPGEELPHVTHFFEDPHRYFRRSLLIVGGRNSALEAAIKCWRAGVDVTVSYRRPEFDRSHVNSRIHLETQILSTKGYLNLLMNSEPVEIKRDRVILRNLENDEVFEHQTDFVLLSTGFTADMGLMRMAGAELRGEDEVPRYDPETMETSVPGLYIAGTICSGNQPSYHHFIGTSHHHTAKILKSITGQTTGMVGTIPSRAYPFTRDDIVTDEERNIEEEREEVY